MKRMVLEIDGREVAFASNAAMPIKYRTWTGRDYYRDIAVATDPTSPSFDIRVLYDVAWTFARIADPEGVPDSAEAWLESFDTFDPLAVVTELAKAFAEDSKQLKKPRAEGKRSK
ncbi:MAG: hypothetical protein Q4C04_04445 [Clostridia bacterium]|nr:hypothetical protein [Clostridia bacterium]